MILVLFIITIVFLFLIFNPYIDIYTDYRGKNHMILWYNKNGERKHIDLIGSQ